MPLLPSPVVFACVVSVLATAVLAGDQVEIDASGRQVPHATEKRSVSTQSGVIKGKENPKYSCQEIIHGQTRFQVLTPQIIRMEFIESSSDTFNDLATFVFVHRDVPCVPFEHTVSESGVTITTESIKLQYIGGGKANEPFTPKTLRATITLSDGSTVAWVPTMKNDGQLFGTIRTLDRVSGAFSLDCDTLPMQSKHPHSGVAQHCTYGIVSRSGWVLVDDSHSPVFDNSDWPWVDQLPNTTLRQDWYLFGHGLNYKKAVSDFSLIAGKQPIPPKHAFGIFYSRWWPWSDWESINIIKEYESNSVPLDVLVTDMDWHRTCYREQDMGYVDLAGQPACWTGWSWDSKYFPNPKHFLDWCERHGIKNTLNLHLASGVQPWEDRFPQMARAMGLDPNEKGVYVEWNVTDKRFSEMFHEHILKPIEEEGIDFWWLDWQQGEGWFRDTFPHLTPTFYLNYVFFTQPGRWGNGDRPLILHRWGGLGNHRYPVGFSGDVYPNWQSLEYQPYMTREAANVLFGYWSHDIGGFMEPAADELYLRWIQYGVFSPIFRTHGTRMAENRKKMWYYKPEFFKAMRAAMQLRSKLMPYLYTAARIAYDTGISVCAPLYYDYPTLQAAYDYKTQYKFGPDIMVAPVVAPVDEATQLVEMTVWIPPGEWIEVMTGKVFKGPKTITRSFGLNEIPYYVKSGGVVVGRLVGSEEEKEWKGWLGRAQETFVGLDVNIYVPLDVEAGASGETSTYDDEGNNVNYQNGKYTWRHVAYKLDSKQMSITIDAPQGTFENMPQQQYYRLVIHGSIPPTNVIVNSQSLQYQPWALFDPRENKHSWHYDGAKVATVICLFDWIPYDQQVNIQLSFGGPFTNAIRAQLNGLAGKIARTQIAKSTLDKSYPESAPNDYEHVTQFAELGMRFSYNPERVLEELSALESNFAKALEHASRFKKAFKQKRNNGLDKIIAAHLKNL